MAKDNRRFNLLPVRATRAHPRTEVIERIAGIRAFDRERLALRGISGILRVLLGDNVDGFLTVHAMLGNGQPRPPQRLLNIRLVFHQILQLVTTRTVHGLVKNRAEPRLAVTQQRASKLIQLLGCIRWLDMNDRPHQSRKVVKQHRLHCMQHNHFIGWIIFKI